MKQSLLVLVIFLISFSLRSQTEEHKSCISAGGGNESYNGHLGNSWFDPGEEWYGFVYIGYSRYLTNSFDVSIHASYGDIGRCRPDGADPSILNLYARMTTGILTFKYKFANGYLLNENARVAPYVFLGGGVNNMEDVWTHYRVNSGNFTSINGGGGFQIRLLPRVHIGYEMSFAYMTSSLAFDYISTAKHDCYMQHTFSLGYDF
jgi:hypothetical protein